jgi:hypothetical protein
VEPISDGGAFDDLSVGVGFVEATDSDMDPQNHEDPKYEAATEKMSGKVEIAINVSPEDVFVLAALERPTSWSSPKSPHLLLFRAVSVAIFLSAVVFCPCAHPTICKTPPGGLPMQSTHMQDKQSGCGRYNGDHTPSAQDCRATSRSVSTPVFMDASSSCFTECLCWRR